jgi:poly-D-alanine transfer protein DltD
MELEPAISIPYNTKYNYPLLQGKRIILCTTNKEYDPLFVMLPPNGKIITYVGLNPHG